MAKIARSARKKESDILYNARRRMLREATRAEKSGDIKTAMEYRSKAEGYKASVVAKGLKRNTAEYAAAISQAAQRATRESIGLTKSGKSREKIAKAMLKGNAGSQFFASTVELWHKPGEKLPYEQRLDRIVKGMGARDLLEAIEILERGTGVSLAESGNTRPVERYDALAVRKGMLYVSGL